MAPLTSMRQTDWRPLRESQVAQHGRRNCLSSSSGPSRVSAKLRCPSAEHGARGEGVQVVATRDVFPVHTPGTPQWKG